MLRAAMDSFISKNAAAERFQNTSEDPGIRWTCGKSSSFLEKARA